MRRLAASLELFQAWRGTFPQRPRDVRGQRHGRALEAAEWPEVGAVIAAT